MQKFEEVKISLLEPNKGQIEGLPANPRFIKDENFEKLKKDIADYPELLEMRGLIVYPFNGKYVLIGGNMRYRAIKELGYKTAPCIIVPEDSPADKLQAYTILDNAPFGEWDWDMLANEWDAEDLDEWGVDVPEFSMEEINEEDNAYTAKIEIPTYEPSENIPALSSLYDTEKRDELVKRIKEANIEDKAVEKMLIESANRHVVFNYDKIADFYSHANKKIQALMEDSALVIIDFDKAIEKGFVELTNKMASLYGQQTE